MESHVNVVTTFSKTSRMLTIATHWTLSNLSEASTEQFPWVKAYLTKNGSSDGIVGMYRLALSRKRICRTGGIWCVVFRKIDKRQNNSAAAPQASSETKTPKSFLICSQTTRWWKMQRRGCSDKKKPSAGRSVSAGSATGEIQRKHHSCDRNQSEQAPDKAISEVAKKVAGNRKLFVW